MKLRRLARLPILALLMLLGSCSPLQLLDAITADGGYKRQADIPYGALPRQRLDVYWPLTPIEPGRPVLVFFYGGSWNSGNRGDYRFIGQSFASAGYVTVLADYRLSPEVKFPAFIEDSAAAVAWVARNIPDASGHIVVAGHSAGAYNAAMLACDKSWLDAAGVGRPVLAGFIGAAGPYDFKPTGEFVQILDPVVMPITGADGHEPPSLLLVAEGDDTVSPGNTDRLAARLQALGDRVEIHRYQGPSHAKLVAALGTALPDIAPARADMLAFLATLRR